MSKRGWIAFSGLLWLGVGVMLLTKGLSLFAQAVLDPTSLCARMSGYFGSARQTAIAFIGVSLALGFVKGRFVFSKTVRRVVQRIEQLSLPIRPQHVYSRPYLLLILSMVGLGLSLRFLPILPDVRGFVDVAIGSALINGSVLFMIAARAPNLDRSI